MEYLMTYGWAILIIAIILAALFNLGVFSNIEESVGNSCEGTVGYICSSPQLASNGLLSVTIGQLGKGTLTVTGLGCSNTTAIPSTLTVTSFSLQPTQSVGVSLTCNLPSSSVGSGFSGTLWMQYSQGPLSGLLSQIGTIKTTVTQSSSTSSNPVLYSVTFDDGTYVSNIIANGVTMNNGAIGNYPSGNTIIVNANTGSYTFNSWTVSSTTNLILGSNTANPTTLTVNGAGTVTALACFAWGTPVSISSIYSEPIQNITVGTSVLSYNSSTGHIEQSQVIGTYKRWTWLTYVIKTGSGSVTTTADHPFYTGNGTFVLAENLDAGENVGVYQNSTIRFTKILSIEISFAPQLMYNLEVNDTHTYFAGGFAVHNKYASP
jgi:hypothetical protein